MATGRTVSAGLLTSMDRQVLELAGEISKFIEQQIDDPIAKREFRKQYGKMSQSRDAGTGVGAGKLQRDALCTRGIQGKAPFSNRNLRWHPLVSAAQAIPFAKPIERIEIEGQDQTQTLVFLVRDAHGKRKAYRADQVYELPQRYVVLPEHWQRHIEILKMWNDVLWTQNSCIITAYEACYWHHAIEAYAVLGINVAINFFQVDFDSVASGIASLLAQQKIDPELRLPSVNFPEDITSIINCPVCLVPISENAARLPLRTRIHRWKPAWSSNKRGEGEDSSLQLTHVIPLSEHEIRHTANNVRYGHRWCNVAMTDHSLPETLDFMEYIVRAHGRVK